MKNMERLKEIVGAIMIIFILLMWIYGSLKSQAEIRYLGNQVEAWQERVKEVEQLNQELIIAQHFEDLFVMCAKPQTLLNLEKLNGYIKNKKEFCLGNHEDPS